MAKIVKKIIHICLLVGIAIWCSESMAVVYSIKELWAGKTEKRSITEIRALDIDKNGIKEIAIVCNYTSPIGRYGIDLGSYGYMKIYEWNGKALIQKWDLPEITKSISTSIVTFRDQANLEVGTFSLNMINYKDGEYALVPIEKSMKLSWQNERIFAKGSFVRKDSEDIIVTILSEKRSNYIRFRDAKDPNNILWTSPVLTKGSGAVVFGDFNNDGKIELLLESGYWIYPDGKYFRIIEIENRKKNKYGATLPLFKVVGTSEPGMKYFKSGKTTSKDIDDILYLESSGEPYHFGEYLIKATWAKDKFEYEKILSANKTAKDGEFTDYNKFDLVDIDSDGIDELIVTEGSGKFIPTGEEPKIENYKERILFLKWSGNKYETIFATQKFKGNTQILIDDVIGDGKKEIIVGNAKGEIHIFGQK